MANTGPLSKQAQEQTSVVDVELGMRNDVQTLQQWLRDLELEQYLEKFQSNSIQVRDLHELTSDMLKEMGIDAIGHRLALLRGARHMKAQRRFYQRNHVVSEFYDWVCCGALDCFRRSYKV